MNPLCCKLNGLLWVYRTSHLLKEIEKGRTTYPAGSLEFSVICRLKESRAENLEMQETRKLQSLQGKYSSTNIIFLLFRNISDGIENEKGHKFTSNS